MGNFDIQVRKRCYLVDELAVEGDAHGTQQKSGILVGLSCRVDSDVTSRNELRRVP